MPYRAVTIHSATWVTGTLTNFPMLVCGKFPFLALYPFGDVINPSGYDMWFSTIPYPGSGLISPTLIPFERVIWNSTTGEVEFWVNVASMSGSGDVVIYLNYGYGSGVVASDLSNPGGTWQPTYEAVYHFGDGVTLDLTDSSGNGNALFGGGSPLPIAGLLSQDQPGAPWQFVGGGVSLNGGNYMRCNVPTTLDITGPLSLECMVDIASNYSAGTYRDVLNISDSIANKGYRLRMAGGTGVGINPFFLMDGFSNAQGLQETTNPGVTSSFLSFNRSMNLISTWDGSNYASGPVNTFVAGGDSAFFQQTHPVGWLTPAIDSNSGLALYVGSDQSASENFIGTLDEVRISSQNHDINWAEAVFNTSKRPGGVATNQFAWFYEIGPAQCPGSAPPPPSTRGNVFY